MATSSARIATIDVVRGFAIFLMVPANMAASVYVEPHALWFRVASSFAAPTFVMVAGMMIVLAQNSRAKSWGYYLSRGILLVGMGAFIDVFVYKFFPFYSFDVLYLIGISCPLT